MRPRQDLQHLLLVIRQEDLDGVKRLYSLDPTLLDRADANGTTALQAAGQVGCHQVLRYLLSQSTGLLDMGNKGNGMTPLMLAAAGGFVKCTQILLDNGASVSAKDKKEWCALYHAAYNGHTEACERLLQSDGRRGAEFRDYVIPALKLAASQRHLLVCQLLLNWGPCAEDLEGEDRRWLDEALAEYYKAQTASKASEKAMSQAASQAAYSDDDEVFEDDGGESGEDEMGLGMYESQERPFDRHSPTAPDSPASCPSPAKEASPHTTTAHHSRTCPLASPLPHLSPPGQGIVHLPTGSRRAHPMYVRHQARDPYVPVMGPAPHAARGTRSSLSGTSSLRSSLPALGGRTAPASASPRSATGRTSPASAMSPAAGQKAGLYQPRIPPRTAGPMRPVMSAQPRTSSAVPGGATYPPSGRPYSTNTFHAPLSGTAGGAAGLSGLPGAANGVGGSGSWTLHAFSYRGMQEGLLLDRDTCLIYWMDPIAQLQRRAQQEAEDLRGEATPPHMTVNPQAHLVGKLLPGVGGLDAPQYGRIAPLTIDDVATVELSKPAMRCLRQTMPAAALLHSCARPAAPNAKLLADLVPGVGGNQALVSATSLAVPLCAVLGVQKVSELANLTEKDLILSEVDTAFLPMLHELAASAGRHDPAAASLAGTRPLSSSQAAKASGAAPRAAQEEGSETGKGQGDSQVEALPSLSQLLATHGLLKLLPQAAEKKLLSSLEVHRWHELAAASSSVPLSRPELVRFRALLSAIRSVQDTALAVQSRRLELLLRLTVGSLVLYEADPLRAVQREERLLGVILEDLGPGVGASGKQYKVRDLLDDSISWMTLGQVRRVAPSEALGHLRADLLPPPTLGCPVTPLSAFPGQPVQVAMWAWTPPQETTRTDALSGARPEPEEDARSRAVQQQVIGKLVQPVEGSDGLRWLVSWPDGSVRTHATGAKGCFDLVHLQLHKLACAPLAHKHYDLLLCGQDMLCVPVVRSPLWARPSTDDTVPGSLGVGCLDASQTALSVMWSRSRAAPPSLYSPDAQGQYPLCHGLLGGWPLTALCAKAGVVVEPGPGGMLSLQGVASGGPGTLVAPVRMAANRCGVVWRVKWAGGAVTEHELGVELQEPELLVHESNMAVSSDNRVALLNEVTKRNAPSKSGAASMAANLGAANAVASLNKAPETAAAAAAAAAGRLGRPLFCRNAAQAARAGMLGALVKLNLGAMALQPGCDQGPMAAYERTTLAAMLEARKAQTPLGPLPRDDVGIVVRDAGPGTWRGLMVRKLGSTEGFWYDEAVLLPATNSDIHKQVLRRGPAYMLPRQAQGVPVTDANAAPGMLVQRAYSAGAVLDGSEKATMLGELVRSAGPHMWEVQWRDGTVGVYKTGANNKFQLCFLNLHAATGAPLLYSTVVSQAAIGAQRMPVTDGPHCVAGGAAPGEVRHVLDPDTMQGLMQQEVSLLSAAGMVVTSTGERRSCGSMLRLYELSHAIVPGDALTIYTAKRGLQVALIEYNTEREQDVEGSGGPSKGPVRLGVLQAPTRLAVQAVLDAGSGGGSGSKNGPTASRPSVLLMDPSKCYWEVLWENGRTEELAVGTQPSHTCLRVAPQCKDPNAEEEQEEGQEEEEEEEESAPKKVEEIEHYVRMVEPIMLLPTRDEAQDHKLVALAKPLQRAIGWNNQLMREMCRVWWWSSRLAAADREEQQKQAGPNAGLPECTQLWRPQLTLVPSQPDQLTLALCAREPEMLRWTPMTEDKEGVVAALVGLQLDEALANAVGVLTTALAQIPAAIASYSSQGQAGEQQQAALEESQRSEFSSEADVTEQGMRRGAQEKPAQPPGQLHLVLQGPAGSTALRLAPNTLVDSAGSTWSAPPDVADAIQQVNAALRAYRASLAGSGQSEEDGDEAAEMSTQYELQISVEPSLESGKPRASRGLSAVLSIVRETPPPLLAPDAAAADQDSPLQSRLSRNHRCTDGGDVTWVEGGSVADGEAITEQQGLGSDSGKVRFVGPAELLSTGEAPALQALLLSGHRALGALHSAVRTSSHQPTLQLTGDTAWCQWVDVPEHPMPQHLGPVRCMAAVNVQLFALRRTCTRLNGAAGLGSANMKQPLLAVLKLVHAKARAALAAHAAERRTQVALERSEKGREEVTSCLEGQEIVTFAWKEANSILARVRKALASLAIAESAAHEATVFAEEAMLLTLFEHPPLGVHDLPRQESARALALAKEATHRAYPEAADAVEEAATSVSETMRIKLVQAERAFQELGAAEERVKEAAREARSAEQTLNSASDEITAAKDVVSRMEKALQAAVDTANRAARMEQEAKDALAEAEEEQAAVNTEDEVAMRAKANGVTSAKSSLEDAEDKRTQAENYVKKCQSDVIKAKEDEIRTLEEAAKTEQAYNAKRAELESTQQHAKQCKQAARRMSPNFPGQEKGGETEDLQLVRAQATTASVEAALGMLKELQAHMPSSLRTPEAMARKLKTAISRMTLICASTAAEWVRTACLPLDALVLGMEEEEQVTKENVLRAQAQKAKEAAEREVQEDLQAMMRSPSQKSMASAPALPTKYVAKLPSVPEVEVLMGRVHKDLMAAYAACHELTPQIEPEAVLEIKDPQAPEGAPAGELSCPAICSSLGRSIMLVASALDKLASAASDNATRSRNTAKAAQEEAAQAKPGPAGGSSAGGGGAAPAAGGGSPANHVPAAVQAELPNALRALRVAEMALRAAKALPSAADIPITDANAAKQLASTLKSVETAAKSAQRSVDDLVKLAVTALVKSSLGSASWASSVLCAAYADLATSKDSKSKEETALWVKEAFRAWSQAREVADQAIKALVPPPPKEKPPAEGAEGEPKEEESSAAAEKAKADMAAAAAEKALAMAETERAINSYITGISLKLALAAAEWASKSQESFDPSSLDDIQPEVAVAVAEWHRRKQGEHSEGQDRPPHPCSLVASLTELAEPLQLVDQAARGAGNQLGLAKLDEAICDTMNMVCGGVKQHSLLCEEGLSSVLQKLEDLEREADGDEEAAAKYAEMKASMPDIVAGYTACAKDGLAGVEVLQPLVSLVLLPEKVDREVEEAQEMVARLQQQAEQHKFASGMAGAAGSSSSNSMEGRLSLRLKVQLRQLEPQQELSTTGRHPPLSASSPRRLGTSATTIQAVPMKAAPSVPAYDLSFCFEPELEDPSIMAIHGEDSISKLMAPARKVLQQGEVDAFLAPYRTLMSAANEAAAAAVAAEAITPSEDLMVMVTGAATAGSKSASSGPAEGVQRYAATTNLSQLRRWAATVANMRAAAALVLQGFQEAAAAAEEELDPLTAPFDL